VEVARALKALADDIGLPAYAKTSGSTGLHVLLPLGGRCTYEESRSLAQLMAWVITRERGDISTLDRAARDRGGKVYLDCLQNVQGQLLASPFSVGPLPGAPVSMPLAWSEVTKKLDPSRFTLRTVVARMEKRGADPMAGLLSDQPDLLKALGRLQQRLEASADGGPGKRGGRG
jgi:bifunctional non-homologous end joining protein LigD